MRLVLIAASLLLCVAPTCAAADPTLAALAAPRSADDDARTAVAIGPSGEVYEPDGTGTAWTRTQRITTSKRISHVGRAGNAVIAFGEGVVYRLAANGWSAVRLHQKERAIMSVGPRAVAAVGRQLFALDGNTDGEPRKLLVAPSNVLAIGAGALPAAAAAQPARGIVFQTDKGLFRVQHGRSVAIRAAPTKVSQLVGDRWALVDNGAVDLDTGRKTTLPAVVRTAAMMADGRLVLVAQQPGGLELVVVAKGKVQRAPIDAPPPASPVGVVLDKAARAVVAFSDGTLLVRDNATASWRAVRITESFAAAKQGPPPARSR